MTTPNTVCLSRTQADRAAGASGQIDSNQWLAMTKSERHNWLKDMGLEDVWEAKMVGALVVRE